MTRQIKAIVAESGDNKAKGVLGKLASNEDMRPHWLKNQKNEPQKRRNRDFKNWQCAQGPIKKMVAGKIEVNNPAKGKDVELELIVADNIEVALADKGLRKSNVVLVLGDEITCRGGRRFTMVRSRVCVSIERVNTVVIDSFPYVMGVEDPGKSNLINVAEELASFCTKQATLAS